MRLNKRWGVAAMLGGLLLLYYGLDLGRFLSLDFVKSSRAELEAWRGGQPLLAATPQAQARIRSGRYKLNHLDYDWALNDAR
jgi:hypothetical protein